MNGRIALVLALLLAVAGIAGCASVPDSSPVQVLGQVGDGEDAQLPPGPAEGSNPLDLVRDFVFASGSSADRHGAARRFLAPSAVDWADGAGLTVIGNQFDTVPAPGAADPSSGTTTIRIRGSSLGRITASGAFEPDQAEFSVDLTLARVEGQWRISQLPDGTMVPLTVLRDSYRTVRVFFVDPLRGRAVADLRYLPAVPTRAQASRALEQLLAGPSAALQGAVTSQLPVGARLRANVAVSSDGALIVDLTQVGRLDVPARELLAAQVVLTLAEVNVARVRLLVDGAPLLPERVDLTRDDVGSLVAEVRPAPEVPTLMVSAGRLRLLTGPDSGTPVPGPLGDGSHDVESAASTADGRVMAAVARTGGRRTLLVGAAGSAIAPVGPEAATMSRPSWTPDGQEVWTVLGGTRVARVITPPAASPRAERVDAEQLTDLGQLVDLRLSRDGMRVVAVVDGMLYTAAVARSSDGSVAVRNVRRLRAAELGEVVAADWRSSDSVVAITRNGELQVAQVSVDGLALQSVLGSNLTPPLTALAAASNRTLLVTDQSGVWSFGGGDQAAWRQVSGGSVGAIPIYPG